MIAVLQRVSEAKVEIKGTVTGSIGPGLVVLLCAVRGDGEEDLAYILRKVPQLRIFEDGNGRMDRSVRDVGGSVLVVSQFTLAAVTRKGNRPSFDVAEEPARAKAFYEAFIAGLGSSGLDVRSGVFGEMMTVSLVNDGPVTIILDSREGRRS